MELISFHELMELQAGVLSRRQLIEAGASDADIRRWVRRRELRRVHAGVYVNHTGPLTWSNRAWAAVLFHWPAALAAESSVNRSGELIHVAVDASRTPTALAGVRTYQLTDLHSRVQWNLGPPRVRVEDALLSMCARASSRVDALALVSSACRRRITTPGRLAIELSRRTRTRHRQWLLQVLQETADGVQSVLEGTYRRKVERAHGLPRPDRQAHERTEDGIVYRDVRYDQYRLVIELDGRIGHEASEDKWDDQDRDLLVAGDDVMTLRLGWRHAESTPCRTAGRLGRVLTSRGWRDRPRPCSAACPALEYFGQGDRTHYRQSVTGGLKVGNDARGRDDPGRRAAERFEWQDGQVPEGVPRRVAP
jgi:hypothetical protein